MTCNQNHTCDNLSLTSVYFVVFDHSRLKIGVSNDVSKRIKSLQVGCPGDIVKLCELKFVSRKAAFRFEKKLHKQFYRMRVSGEWFAINPLIRETLNFIRQFDGQQFDEDETEDFLGLIIEVQVKKHRKFITGKMLREMHQSRKDSPNVPFNRFRNGDPVQDHSEANYSDIFRKRNQVLSGDILTDIPDIRPVKRYFSRTSGLRVADDLNFSRREY